jgi:MoxR-like ATPase
MPDPMRSTLPESAPPDPAPTPQVEAIERAGAQLATARDEIGRVILGQSQMVEQALIALLCGGHALLVGLPGLGKSRLVETLGTVLGLDSKRVQFTPDLMPADILGSEVLEDGDAGRRFRFLPGPVFCQLLMADEINRASPRTQSALLQAMQERHVSIAGHDHALPAPFHVLATQNPIEQEGTYPLPEAQLDRFLLQIDVTYPDRDAERRMLLATTGASQAQPRAVLTAADLAAAQMLVRRMPIGESIVEAILSLVRDARPDNAADPALQRQLAWGPGPRAAQALMLATRARALLDQRLSPSLADVQALAQPVLRHRMALTFAARAEGAALETIIERLAGRLG